MTYRKALSWKQISNDRWEAEIPGLVMVTIRSLDENSHLIVINDKDFVALGSMQEAIIYAEGWISGQFCMHTFKINLKR